MIIEGIGMNLKAVKASIAVCTLIHAFDSLLVHAV